MSIMMAEPIAGREAWLGADMARSTEWIRPVSPVTAAELDAALRGLECRGLAWPRFGRDEFALPTFSRELSSVLDELEHGRGFVLLRGIPVGCLPALGPRPRVAAQAGGPCIESTGHPAAVSLRRSGCPLGRHRGGARPAVTGARRMS